MSKTKTIVTSPDRNREQWLLKAVSKLTPLFTEKGYKVPSVRVSCGWPSSRGLGKGKHTIGECWDASAASDKVHQIFITPRTADPCEPYGILPTLAHEVAHAVVGIKERHNKVFGKCVRALGLEGKLTSTYAGPEFLEMAKNIVKEIGEYPHAALNPSGRPTKKQSTRLVKCECPDCGYNVRVTRKWLDTGAPICPCNEQAMKFEIPGELDGGGDDE